MRISSGDIDDLVTAMGRYLDEGFYEMSYDKSAFYLKNDDVSFFDNEFDKAVHRSFYPDHHAVSLIPIFEVLQIIQEKAKVLGEGWSLPLDIPLIGDNYQLRKEFKNMIMDLEKNVKPENLNALQKRFVNTGMADINRDQVIEKMEQGEERFSVDLKAVYPDGTAEVKVNCKLSKGDYYPEDYDITVKQEGKPDYTRNYKFENAIAVTVKLEDGKEAQKWINGTITLKEAYNQMCGRAINKNRVFENKEDPTKNRLFNRWELIDFTQTVKVDGKDIHPIEKIYKLSPEKLEKEFKAHPFLENKDPDEFQEKISSIRRGNIQLVHYENLKGEIEKLYLKANPAHDMLQKYDQFMNPIDLSMKREQELSESQQQNQDKSKDVNQKQDQKNDKLEQKEGKKKGMRPG